MYVTILIDVAGLTSTRCPVSLGDLVVGYPDWGSRDARTAVKISAKLHCGSNA